LTRVEIPEFFIEPFPDLVLSKRRRGTGRGAVTA
jgi:hypothetical protein